jgi:hypothetical protein
MKTAVMAVLAAGLAMTPLAARAQVIDVATVKCSELASMSDEEGSFLFTWLLGYQGGLNGTTTMDIGEMETIGQKIGEYCAENPDAGVLSATTEVMSE